MQRRRVGTVRHAAGRHRSLHTLASVLVVMSGLGISVFQQAIGAVPAHAYNVPSAVTDVNPNAVNTDCNMVPGSGPNCSTLYGGRTEAFAVNPVNTQIVFAATETGGLWKSTDHGASWTHVDQLPLTEMKDVAYAPGDVNVLVAAGNYDGSVDNRGGGIWHSADGGATWSKSAGVSGPNPCSTLNKNNGHKIGFATGSGAAVTVFVGTDCGMVKSTDSGATFALADPTGNGGNQIWDVKTREVATPTPHTQIDACGFAAYYRSNDGGATWSSTGFFTNSTDFPRRSFGSSGAGIINPPCRVATAPNNPNTVLVSAYVYNPAGGNPYLQLDENDNGGATGSWVDLTVSTDQNGRDTWVKTFPSFTGDSTKFETFVGTDSIVVHQTCSTAATPMCSAGTLAATEGQCFTNDTCTPNSSGAWAVYDQGIEDFHFGTDPTDIAFDPNVGCPFLESGDGGAWGTSNGCNASPTWTDNNKGLHALWIYQLAGTAVPSGSPCCPSPHTDIYSGMQDNGANCSVDDAQTFSQCSGADVFQTLADRTGPPSQVLLNSDGGYGLESENNTSNPTFTSPTCAKPVNQDSTPCTSGHPAVGNIHGADQFGYQSYAFLVDDGASTPSCYVVVTTDNGGTWKQDGPKLPACNPGLANGEQPIAASGVSSSPVFYLELNPSSVNTLYRLEGTPNTGTTLTSTGTATLSNASGASPHTITKPTVFNVNPANPLDLYATDASGAGQAMSSTDGGQSWYPDAALTSIVTRSGAFPFLDTAPEGQNISSFGFDPNSNTILAGTNFSGVYASTDSGAHWIFLPGSAQMPRVGDFFFDSRNPGRVYAGTMGRGIWKIHIPTADLSISLSHSPDPVNAGDTLFYSVTVTNYGPDGASAITVTDNLPSQVTYLANNNSCVESPVGSGKLTCAVPDLASGSSDTFTIKVQVKSNAAIQSGGPTSFDNTATVATSEAIDPVSSNNSSTDTTFVNESADLEVTKTCDSSVQAGQTAHCTIYVDNHGLSDARNVVVSDQITSTGTFTLASATPSQGSPCTGIPGGPASNATITCNIGNLAAASTSQTGRATVTLQLNASDAQTITDVAQARSDTPDPNGNNNQATSSIAFTAVADVAITAITATPNPVTAGTTLTKTITIHNGGPSIAQAVVLQDTVPAGVTITSVTGSNGAGCTAGVPGDSTQPATCSYGNLNSGDTRTMTILVKVNAQTTGILHDDARVSSSTFDPNLSNNLAHTDTTVQASADLSTTITATPNPVTAGTALSYQITVSNAGPSTAVAVTLTDTLPAALNFTSASTSAQGGSCGFQVNTNTVQCQLGNVDPGQSAVVYIYEQVSSAATGTILDSASAASSTPDPVPGNNTGNVSTAVATSAELSVGLTTTTGSHVYKPSTSTTFVGTVNNAGPSDALSVQLVFTLPGSTIGNVVSNTGGCSVSATTTATTVTCSLGTMATATSRTIQVQYFIKGNQKILQNSDHVTSTTSDPTLADNSANWALSSK